MKMRHHGPRATIKHTLGSGLQYKIFKKSEPLFYFDFECRTFKESNATINMMSQLETPATIGFRQIRIAFLHTLCRPVRIWHIIH